MEALGAASSVIAVLDLSAKVAKLCFQYSKEVKDAKESISRLREQATELGNITTSLQTLLNGPNGHTLKSSQQLGGALNNGASQLERVHETLQPKSARQALSRLGLRSLKWPFERIETEKLVEGLRQTTQTISLALQIDQTERLLQIDKKLVLGELRVAEGAYFDSQAQEHGSTCLPNTRVELLRQISDWVRTPGTETQPIFWLNGMAGTGKSTISRSVANSFSDAGILGASFFFKKGEADRQGIAKLFTTLAADLVTRKPYTVPGIKEALESDGSVATKNAREQFDKLLFKPLSTTTAKDDPVLIVVDALDECERDEDVKLLIHLFSKYKNMENTAIKLFVTSRPDLPIRLGFRSIQGSYESFVLHEIPEPVVKSDISVYLQHELSSIRSQYDSLLETDQRLGKDWPGQADFEKLLDMSIPLFIAAATICRFISETRFGTPNVQLQRVLERQGDDLSQLSQVYRPVLENLIAGIAPRQQQRILDEFRNIVGPIAILATPLSVSTLSKLLDISKDVIIGRLALLHSVLSVPSSIETPVRLLHLSFRDFLIDDDELNAPFRVHERETHEILVNHCLRVLDALKQDICALDKPGIPRSEIPIERINTCLPLDVQYACLYLPYHLERSQKTIVDGGQIYEFLKRHFLNWMEALSLLDRAWEIIALVQTLQSGLDPLHSTEVATFLEDALRFVQTNVAVIDEWPLQLYSSLLMFAPEESRVKTIFRDQISHVAAVLQADQSWGQCVQVLEEDALYAPSNISFSHDSTLVASNSWTGMVCIWRVATGECVEGFRIPYNVGDTDAAGGSPAAAFSHDLGFILSARGNGDVELWQTNSGQLLRVFDRQQAEVISVTFSKDSTLVAVVYAGGFVCVWEVEQDSYVRKTPHPGFGSVKLSPDFRVAVGVLDDLSVQILDIETGDCVDLLHTTPKNCSEMHLDQPSLAFSSDSRLVLATIDESIFLWSTTTRELVKLFEGQTSILTATLSQDSKVVCSASYDALCLWSVDTGQRLHTLRARDGHIESLAISPDLKLIASGQTVSLRLWNFDLTAIEETIHNETEPGTDSIDRSTDGSSIDNGIEADIGDVAPSSRISPNGTLVAVEKISTLDIWSLDTRKRLLGIDVLRSGRQDYAFSKDSSLIVMFDMNYREHSGLASMWHIGTGVCCWSFQVQVEKVGQVLGAEFSPDAAVFGLVSEYGTRRKPALHSSPSFSSSSLSLPTSGNTACRKGSQESLGSFLRGRSFLNGPIDPRKYCSMIQIWNAKNGEYLKTLDYDGTIISLSFSDDCKSVAAGTREGTIELWDVDSGSRTRSIKDHVGKVTQAIFLPEARVASFSDDLTIRIWNRDGSCLGKIYVGADQFDLRSCENGFVHSLRGSLDLRGLTSSPGQHRRLTHIGFGLDADQNWITWNEEYWLWLPIEYRPGLSHVTIDKGISKIVVVSSAGKISVFEKAIN
ncbi:hypothetical protein NLG97_g4300 [Lecanicillium saksenae]|uniref:Uncharacterized protein n=1 Tax=Lecanicillium saksenae TaxID=468837 RepID=A0ACC1QXF0_9HYPO|nr:hypothetical protein NLG97_g4300 [Lecanicillium saksenae]